MLFPCFVLVLFSSISDILASIAYPAHIRELGDVVVSAPILDTCPEGSVIIPSSSTSISWNIPSIQPMRIYSQPALNFVPLEAVTTYFMEKNMLDLINGESPLTDTDAHFANLLRNHLNHFNPSFLDDYYYTDRHVIAIGAVFLRLFKTAYPGLFRVQLTKNEIVDLCLIASGWFMSHEENENNWDTFFSMCLHVYHPEYSPTSSNLLPAYNLTYWSIYQSGSKIVFEAALQIPAKRILKRSNLCLDELYPAFSLIDFLDNREIFLKLHEFVEDINYSNLSDIEDSHLLIFMIKRRIFYPEAFLRPELRDIQFNCGDIDVNFYSVALFYALEYSNVPAIEFLLNLDYSFYYQIPQIEANDDSDSDSDWSVAPVPLPLSLEDYTIFRAIFYSETVEQVIQIVPEVFEFEFCHFSSQLLIEKFKNHFPSLMRLHELFMSHGEHVQVSGEKRTRSESFDIYDDNHRLKK